jgi:hypothetical protein
MLVDHARKGIKGSRACFCTGRGCFLEPTCLPCSLLLLSRSFIKLGLVLLREGSGFSLIAEGRLQVNRKQWRCSGRSSMQAVVTEMMTDEHFGPASDPPSRAPRTSPFALSVRCRCSYCSEWDGTDMPSGLHSCVPLNLAPPFPLRLRTDRGHQHQPEPHGLGI